MENDFAPLYLHISNSFLATSPKFRKNNYENSWGFAVLIAFTETKTSVMHIVECCKFTSDIAVVIMQETKISFQTIRTNIWRSFL